MKRYAFWLALVSLSFSSFALSTPAFAASAEAKKACGIQWDAEKKANTIPRGMTREKYIRLCTKNYVANNTTPPTSVQPPSGETAQWPATTPAPGH